jgi:hypothetical protein
MSRQRSTAAPPRGTRKLTGIWLGEEASQGSFTGKGPLMNVSEGEIVQLLERQGQHAQASQARSNFRTRWIWAARITPRSFPS